MSEKESSETASAIPESLFDDLAHVDAEVARGNHRELIGGMWEELGSRQVEFMKANGLRTECKLLDIGCGCLRGGVYFAEFLDPGNYYGIDRHAALIEAGYEKELTLKGLRDRVPRDHLRVTENFDLTGLDETFDFAIAQSLFTHLNENWVRVCLERVAPAMKPGGILFATYFELPEDAAYGEPFRNPSTEIVTYGAADPYHYKFSDLEALAKATGWSARRVGEWGHPRGQCMAAFERFPERPFRPAEGSLRNRSASEAVELSPGSDHYRAFVGPADRFDFMSATQFALLFATGLREGHRVLDIGCGSLRLGRLLIPFLAESRYFGVEPERWLVEDGISRELGEDALRLKKPRFAYRSDFNFSEFSKTFDFVMAQSIATHTGPDLLRALFRGTAATLAEDGLFLFSFIQDGKAGSAPPDGWSYPQCVKYSATQMTRVVEEAGLCATPIPWHHPEAAWWAVAHHPKRLPSESEKKHLTGITLNGRPGQDSNL